MLTHCGQFHHGHLEGTVPAYGNHLPLRLYCFDAYSRRNRIPHSTHSAGGQEFTFSHLCISTGPDLILSHICHIDGIFRHFDRKLFDKCRRVHISRIRPARFGQGIAIFVQHGNPFLKTAGKLFHFKILKNMFGVSYQRNGRTCIFTDFRRVHINVHKHFIPGNHIRLVHRSIRYPGAYHNQKIRVVHGTVGIRLSVISHHPIVKRVICRHDTDSHHSRYHWNAMIFCKFAQLVLCVAQQNTAACTDNRSFSFFQLRYYFFNLYRMSLYGRLVRTQRNFLRIFEFTDCRILNVNGHIYQHRASSACVCYVKSFLENPGNIVYIPDQIAVFYERLHRSRNIGFLEYVAAQKFAVHLTRNAD